MASAEGMIMAGGFGYVPESMDAWPSLVAPAPAADFSIIHELSLMSEKLDSPATSMGALPALPAAPPPTKKRRMEAAAPSPLDLRRAPLKTELLIEPVTPPHGAPRPLSPPGSSCSDEDMCSPTLTPKLEPSCAPLPAPTASVAAARRAARRAALKRSRSRKDTTPPARRDEPLTTGDVPDKKAARAIRNREAAMKSRVEAKQKMQRLEQDNERLAKTVDDLTASNKLLAAQIKALTRSLCPGPGTPARTQEILALTAQITCNGADL